MNTINPGARDKPHILIVDDNVAFCDTLKSFLEANYYPVTGVYTSLDAIIAFKKDRRSIVVLDMKLEPGISGADVYFTIKSLEPDVRVILMTAFRQEMDPIIEDALRRGARGCLDKPFDPNDLIKVIEEME
ncbi:MAG: response regulator [Candidatus Auribacterota bacterium]|nr:response regulator [Candidatus Auribacterota bacterium]